MKKNKICPKCSSNEIYHNGDRSISRSHVSLTAWRAVLITTYICISCGYKEEYLSEESLKNEKNIKAIKEKWTRR